MLRAVKEIQPRWIVGENVYGLVNWSGGLVFHEVQADLEAEGYEVFPYLLPAVSVNAPHRRDRIWFVAHRDNYGLNQCNGNNEVNASERGINAFSYTNESNGNGDVADPDCTNSQTWSQRQVLGQQNREKANGHSNVERRNQWQNFPTISPVHYGDDGISDRLDSITFPKWRNESIKAGGNAIVPQVVYQIFKAIEQYERISTTSKSI